MEEKIRLAVFGQKRLSREGGIEIVVKELCTRMAQNGCDVTCYNRAGHHVSGAEYDKTIEYDGIRQKVVPTIEKKGLAAVSSSFFAALCSAYRAVRKLRTEPTEEHLWEVVLLYAGVRFKTYSGLPFTYEIRKGRNGQYTKELWIDRRENSKSLAWSSVLLALGNIKKVEEVVERPKALGDIRGVTYIYGMFYRFGLIDVPDEAKEKMKKAFSKSS